MTKWKLFFFHRLAASFDEREAALNQREADLIIFETSTWENSVFGKQRCFLQPSSPSCHDRELIILVVAIRSSLP